LSPLIGCDGPITRRMGTKLDCSKSTSGTEQDETLSIPQAAGKAQAQKAEANLAEIRASFRQEQLTVMAKIQRLENDLRIARLDAQLAESNSRTRVTSSELIQETEPFR